MLNAQQKKFRKEMAEIKKEKGHLYDEIYHDNRPNRPCTNTSSISFSRLIRVVLFLSFTGWTLYGSGMLELMINNQGAISHYTSKQPKIIKSVTRPLVAKKEQGCSDYLQDISAISQGLSKTIEDYTKENKDYSVTKEMLNKHRLDLDQIETIKHGEALRELVVENLAVSAHYIDLIDKLRENNVFYTEEDQIRWVRTKETAEELHAELTRISVKHKEEIKVILEKYDMGYTETEDGVKYYYMIDEIKEDTMGTSDKLPFL